MEYGMDVDARAANKCKRFQYDAIDSLMSADRDGEIHKHSPKKLEKTQLDGQLSLFG